MIDNCILFDARIAEKYSLEEAIVIHKIYGWIKHNAVNGKNYHDGRYWTFNSLSAFAKYFPFWSESKVKRILIDLYGGSDKKEIEPKHEQILLKGNFNKSSFDRTVWYSFTDDFFNFLSSLGYTLCADIPQEETPFSESDQMDIPQAEKRYQQYTQNKKNKDANASSSESNSDNEVDYEKLIAYWNERTKGVWGILINIKNNRLKMVRARVREHGKRALFDAINIACESPYLRGETWFNFDWLIKPNNFDKLISGNYNHEQRAKQQLELNNVRLGKGEQIDNQGDRFYMQGRTKIIVPIDAEPRPSDSHYWSESRKTWYYNGM